MIVQPLALARRPTGAMAEVKKVSVDTDEEASLQTPQTTTARPGADPPVKKLTKKYVPTSTRSPRTTRTGTAPTPSAREAWLKEIALYEFNMGRYCAVASANAREIQYASASAAADGEARDEG